jgi:hypothetical protein
MAKLGVEFDWTPDALTVAVASRCPDMVRYVYQQLRIRGLNPKEDTIYNAASPEILRDYLSTRPPYQVDLSEIMWATPELISFVAYALNHRLSRFRRGKLYIGVHLMNELRGRAGSMASVVMTNLYRLESDPYKCTIDDRPTIVNYHMMSNEMFRWHDKHREKWHDAVRSLAGLSEGQQDHAWTEALYRAARMLALDKWEWFDECARK